jgi:integrase/recombinase XerD
MSRPKRTPIELLEASTSMEPGSLGAHVRSYLEHMGVLGQTEDSLRSAAADLRVFLTWAEGRGLRRLDEVTVSVLERYQRHLYHYRMRGGRPLSFRTQRVRLLTLKRFYRYLVRQRVLEMSPAELLELPRAEKRLPRTVLTVEQVEAVLAEPDPRTMTGLRDRAILETLYSTGIRRQEAVDLDLYDVDAENGTLRIREGKGKKDRLIPLGERAALWITKYLDEARPYLVSEPDDGALFLTTKRARFAPETLSRLVRKAFDAAGVAGEGACHVFRHTMATLMLEGGADLRFIQAMLGHAEITSTQVYTHVALRKLKEVYERTHPGARLARREPATGDAGDEEEPTPASRSTEILAALDAEAAEEDEKGGAPGTSDEK